MKVWVLVSIPTDDNSVRVLGVYSSLEAAREAAPPNYQFFGTPDSGGILGTLTGIDVWLPPQLLISEQELQ